MSFEIRKLGSRGTSSAGAGAASGPTIAQGVFGPYEIQILRENGQGDEIGTLSTMIERTNQKQGIPEVTLRAPLTIRSTKDIQILVSTSSFGALTLVEHAELIKILIDSHKHIEQMEDALLNLDI